MATYQFTTFWHMTIVIICLWKSGHSKSRRVFTNKPIQKIKTGPMNEILSYADRSGQSRHTIHIEKMSDLKKVATYLWHVAASCITSV